MKPDGCPVGSRRYGNKCINDKLPMIGTYLVPSVENRAGCDYVKGKWVDPGVCLLQDPYDDPNIDGLTAPVKGMYIWWNTQRHDGTNRKGPGEYYYYINGSLLADSPDYPIVMGGMCPVIQLEGYFEMPSVEAMMDAVRDDVLTMAKDIMDGRSAYDFFEGASYYRPDGRPTTHHDRDAVYCPGDGEYVKDRYKEVDQRPFDAFRFRNRGGVKKGQRKAPRRKFEIEKDAPPTEPWLPYKPRTKEGWNHKG